MTFAALGQVRADDRLRMARSLGYGPVCAWLKVVLPPVYPQIRLPVYAVLAYSLSVVDMAIVLGPTTPPTLAVLVLRWFNDPDLAMRFQAAAGACLQLAIVVGGDRPLARPRDRARTACPAVAGRRPARRQRPAGQGSRPGPASPAADRPGARQRAQPRRLVGRGPLAVPRCLAGGAVARRLDAAAAPRGAARLDHARDRARDHAARRCSWSRAASRTRAGSAIGRAAAR